MMVLQHALAIVFGALKIAGYLWPMLEVGIINIFIFGWRKWFIE